MASDGRLRDLFLAARQLPREEAVAFLARHCLDAATRAEVESLLVLDSTSCGFLDRPLLQIEGAFETSADPHPFLLVPGIRLGDFVIDRFLSSGGSGEVYAARQLSLGGRSVALKLLRVTTPKDRERFEREATIAASLHHPNLVTVFGFGEERNRPYLVMRLVDGRSLEAARTSLSEPPRGEARRSLVRRLVEVARGLQALHERGMVHGDVKPSNIVLEGDDGGDELGGSAVLVDFGLARPLLATRSTIFATPGYAAPEALSGGRLDARSDVYGLGLCALDLLSARGPEQRERKTDGTFESLTRLVPDVDKDLEAIVARAIDPVADWRYPDGGALAEDLVRWLNEEPVDARRLSAPVRMRRWLKRNPARILRWLGRIALVGMIAGISAGLMWLGSLHFAARAARSSWHEGRFDEALIGMGRIPASLQHLLLPRELADRESSSTPVSEVLRLLEREGRDAARLLAARYLERDGLEAQPELVAFVARDLRSEQTSERSQAIALVARLFYERPDRSPEAVRASEPIRRELRGLLFAEHEDSLSVVTALSGCGTHEDVVGLLDALLAREDQELSNLERARLSFAAAATITRRSLECGFGAEFASTVTDEILRQACGYFDRLHAENTPAVAHVEFFLSRWLEDDAFARAKLGLPSSEILPRNSGRARWARVRAARQDPKLLMHLSAGPGLFPAIEPGAVAVVQQFGAMVGSYGAAELEDSLVLTVEEFARDHGEEAENAVAAYRRYADSRRSCRGGFDVGEFPDEDTHLGLEIETNRLEPLDLSTVMVPVEGVDLGAYSSLHPEADGLRVWADFTFPHIQVAGEAVQTRGLGVNLRLDEYLEGHSTLRFSRAGKSEVTLQFTTLESDERLVAVVEFQKANRSSLPWFGRAQLVIELDGKPCAAAFSTSGAGEVLVCPLPTKSSTGMTRSLTLRLGAESNTTLWLYRVIVFETEVLRFWR